MPEPALRACAELSGSTVTRRRLVVIDACNLTRNLVLVGELLAYDLPVVVALNMIDLRRDAA